LAHEQHYSSKKIILVLDTTAFIAKYQLQAYSPFVEIYTTPSVIQEAKDRESRDSLQLSLDIGRVFIKTPSKNTISEVVKVAREIGEHTSLSQTDIEVIALAKELSRKGKVIVITDDYSIQNTLLYLRISFKPLRTMGIKYFRKYVVRCPKCGYTTSSNETICPICDSRLVKKSS